jgi:hypothetical protein
MANTPFQQKRFQGIADYTKESANGQIESTVYFCRAVNYRDDPSAITLLPASVKESGSNVTDLIKWGELVPVTLNSYFYGNVGNIYQRTSAASWSNLHTAPVSHGNGMAYFTGDDYLYYTTDKSFGRYGPMQNSPAFTDDYLKSLGGVAQNTNSLSVLAASSMYATAADSASLSVTGNLTLETYFKATTLPTVGNSMTLIGKWDESGATRSYKLDLYGVSGYFGDGSDGALVISTNTTEAPIDSACSGTAGTQSLTATNVSFAAGQVILIHQTQGSNAGQYERNKIQGYTAGTITLDTPLIGSYTTGAQVRVLKQYTNVTINSAKTYTAKAWNGTVGGILAFLASGTVTVTGLIDATGKGFRGGIENIGLYGNGYCGEGTVGASYQWPHSNGNGGGGGDNNIVSTGGAGGGNANAALDIHLGNYIIRGGLASGSNDLTTMTFGGGGGGAGNSVNFPQTGAIGGTGGGIIFISGVTVTITGSIVSNGNNGGSDSYSYYGGSGAGGSILIKTQVATLGTSLILSNGGSAQGTGDKSGGAGSVGRIAINYLTSYTGTTNPTLNPILDNTLVTTTTIQARLGISNDGTNFEYLTQNLNNLTTATWNRLSVTWLAASSLATFYLNAVALGTSTGTKTAIHDNASLLYVGANKTSVAANFFNGLIDDIRIWNNVQTATQITTNLNQYINVASSGLQAYYHLDNALTDATSNANTLTGVNTPTFSVDVPFPAYTTRLDIDAQSTNTGQTYTLLTSISEAAADKLSFTPVNDPQASVGFYVDTKGTGNFTVTVHDNQNKVIATSTVLTANIPTAGFVEFFFTPWRIITGKSYHIHLTVSTGTSKVVTGTTADFSTAEYKTFFGWLVTDTQFHPAVQFQYQPLGGVLTGAMIYGNERYLAVWDGANYSPNFIAFPPAWHVRCFGFWREFLAIGMWRGGNIYDFSMGRIYFWDGIGQTYNFFIDVPDGPINAMFGVDTDLFFFAGWRGQLLDYQGGYFYNTGNTQSAKLKRMPLIAPGDYTEVNPGAINMWRGLLHFGLFANSNSTTMQRGVYSFGTLNQYYPSTLSYDYVVSTGSRSNTVTIGCVYPVGQSLIVGWQDGIAYGADMVNFGNAPAPSGEIQLLIQDDGSLYSQKENFVVRADFMPLKTGESVDVKYNVDRSGWITSTLDTTVGDIFTKQTIGTGRSREVQIGVDIYATGLTSPTLLSIAGQHDTGSSETAF